MRISDWSSDVCSSDLVLAKREAARRALAADLDADLADHVMHHEQWMRARDTLQPLAEQRVRLETASYGAGRARLVDIADAYGALDDATLPELRRASCRERVCKYVSIWVVCVSLQNQYTQNTEDKAQTDKQTQTQP